MDQPWRSTFPRIIFVQRRRSVIWSSFVKICLCQSKNIQEAILEKWSYSTNRFDHYELEKKYQRVEKHFVDMLDDKSRAISERKEFYRLATCRLLQGTVIYETGTVGCLVAASITVWNNQTGLGGVCSSFPIHVKNKPRWSRGLVSSMILANKWPTSP